MRNRYLWILLIVIILFGSLVMLLQTKADNIYTIPTKKLPVSQIDQKKTYVNTTYGFSFAYPSTWTYRQFEAGNGVGFRLVNKPDSPEYEYITWQVSQKPQNIANLAFADYVKVAAINEIQNYQKLYSIKPFTTKDGLTGYITTWMVQPLGGGVVTPSLPIAYIPSKNSTETIEVFLSNKAYMDVFTDMIKTFHYN